MGNPTEIKDAFGNITANSYDSMGNLIEIITNVDTDVETKSKHSYDKLGRLLEVEDAENGISKYGYDKMGNITSLTDPNGGITTYEYDKMGRLLLESNAIGSEKSYTYNAVGLLEESINGRKQVAIYKYDDAGRITSITDELGTTSYTYDANGNILTVSDDKGTISRKYDALNRVTEYTDYKGNTVKYSYDQLGNLISLTYPGGEIVRYTYNLNGQINEVIDWQDRITTYEYDLNGRLTKVNRPEGSIETYEYDKAGRIISQENKNGNEIINHYTYTYDEANNIIEKTSTEKESAKNLKSSTMKYDKANRLISYNDQEVRYDDDGNMTYGPLDGEMTEFTYDCRNRLISAGNLSYEYDAENNRIAITDSKENTRTEFVINTNSNLSQILTENKYKLGNDGNIIDTDTDNENLSTTNYIHGLGLIAQENDEGGYLTYHYDHLGSTTAITNETGEVIHTYTYGPYGELLSGDPENIRFLYNGMYGVSTDSNGLYYMRARYYNVDIKRFISQDILTGSISNSPSLNRYSYVQGNPISLTDPFGLSPDISWRGFGHAVLDLLGCVPVVGFVFDLANAAWYYSEGDTFGVTTSLISAVPGFGSFAGNTLKWGAKGSKKLMLIGDLVINGTKAIGSGATLARGTYGAVVSGSRIVTDIKEGRDVNFWDALQFGLNSATVKLSSNVLVKSGGASINNVKGLNGLRASKGAVGGSDQLVKMDLQFFASSKNSKGGLNSPGRPTEAQGFSKKGYNPQPGERTLEGYVKQNASPEVALYTKSAKFNNSKGNVGGQFKRLGAEEHYGLSPHVHQPIRNVAPNGTIYGKTGKTVGVDTLSPDRKDVKQLYEYLNNGKYHQ